jgi:OOP family OmpA-OmpF porin
MKSQTLGRALVAAAIAAPMAIGTPPVMAQVKSGWYGQVSAGALWVEDNEGTVNGVPATAKYETGFAIWGATGYRFGNGIRTELELGYVRTRIDKIQVLGNSIAIGNEGDLFTGTINGFYDVNTGTFMTPYIGAGIGFAYQKADGATVAFGGQNVRVEGKAETDLTAFGELGIALRASQNTAIVPSYRYQWIDNGGGGFDDNVAHIARIGVRFSF